MVITFSAKTLLFDIDLSTKTVKVNEPVYSHFILFNYLLR